MPQTITVKFDKKYGPYIPDQIATFPYLIGTKLIIENKVATEYVEPKTVDPKKTKVLPERNTTKSITTK